MVKKDERNLYLLQLYIGKTLEERAALQSLQEEEKNKQLTDWDDKIDLNDILHGTDVFSSSHGGEEIDELGQAIMGDLWKL